MSCFSKTSLLDKIKLIESDYVGGMPKYLYFVNLNAVIAVYVCNKCCSLCSHRSKLSTCLRKYFHCVNVHEAVCH
jgi:hypothetical protein